MQWCLYDFGWEGYYAYFMILYILMAFNHEKGLGTFNSEQKQCMRMQSPVHVYA